MKEVKIRKPVVILFVLLFVLSRIAALMHLHGVRRGKFTGKERMILTVLIIMVPPGPVIYLLYYLFFRRRRSLYKDEVIGI